MDQMDEDDERNFIHEKYYLVFSMDSSDAPMH